MPGKIFVSYRRDDAAGDARGVRDGLVARFGKSNVFMDVDNLLAGQRFDKELAKALTACDVLVAIIGPRWLALLKARIVSEERDYIREEISAALKRGIIVIPARIGREGHMPALPRPEDLPEDIRDLVLYQKHDITHEHFGRDMTELSEAITKVRGSGAIWTNIIAARVPWRWIAVGGFAFILASAAAYYSGVFVSRSQQAVVDSPLRGAASRLKRAIRAKVEEPERQEIIRAGMREA
ncbi:MAG: toll/interleukin-1 receptor domain-containing protein [Rhodoplanes sp.]